MAPPTTSSQAQARPDGRRGTPCQETTSNAFCMWWKSPEVKKELGLTDEKARRIDSIYRNRETQAQPFADELDKERDVLDQMTKERKVSPAMYSVQVTRVLNLETKLRETRTVMLYRIYLELTPDQITKLEAMQREFRNRTGRGGQPSK